MSKRRISIALDSELENWLSNAAKTTGKSLSKTIHLCLVEFKNQNPDKFSRTSNDLRKQKGWEARDRNLDSSSQVSEVFIKHR